MDHELVVYDDDDVTPLWAVGTSASHANPYLAPLGEASEAEIDLAQGKAHIGYRTVRIIDPQSGLTKQQRWLTSRLGTAEGFSALNRRRVKITEWPDTSVLVTEGVWGGVSLNPSFAGFTVPIRDVRDRGRKVPAFNRTETSTVLPRGVLAGYGTLPDGALLISPTVPLIGTYVGNATSGNIQIANRGTRVTDRVNPLLIVTDAMRAAMKGTTSPVDGMPIYGNVAVRWRAAGSADAWKVIRSIRTGANDVLDEVGMVMTAKRRVLGRSDEEFDAAQLVHLSRHYGGDVLPTDGQSIEFVVVYTGAPTEQYPFHYEGTWGELVRNVLRGDYSYRDDGTTMDPRLLYDEAAILAIDLPVRVRLTKPIEDIRTAIEQLHQQIGAAPALNEAGEISPVRYQLPPQDEVLPQIDDTNAVAIPGWEHPADNAVTTVEITYPRDYLIPATRDPAGTQSAGDGITSREIIHIMKAPQSVLDIMGEQDRLTIDAWALRALGGADGNALTGDILSETGAQVALGIGRMAIDRFAWGGQVAFVRIAAADFLTLEVGAWVIDARSWVPNYLTGERSANALAQVVSLKRVNDAWYDARLIYSSPEDAPLAAPTFAAATVDDDGVVSVDALTWPAGADVELQYATGSLPLANSDEWIFADRDDSSGLTADPTLQTPALPANTDVFLRGRSIAVGRRPSAWVSIADVTTPSIPRVRDVRVEVDVDGTATVFWTPNSVTEGARLNWEIHSPDDTPTLPEQDDVDADLGFFILPDPLRADQALTVDVTPYTGWTGSAVSGTAGDPIRATFTRPPTVGVVTPAVRPVPSESGTTGTLTLTISDPQRRVTAVRYALKEGAGGFGAFTDAAWDVSTGVVGVATSLTRAKNITLNGIHNVAIAWELEYEDDSGTTLTIAGSHTFDVDQIPEILSASIGLTAGGDIAVSYKGDEDGANFYILADTAPIAGDPSSSSFDGTSTDAVDTVDTGVPWPAGATAYAKIRARHADGTTYGDTYSIGPIARPDDAPRVPVVDARPSQSGGTGTLDIIVTDPSLVVTSVQWSRKIGDGAYSAFSATGWDSSTGVAGVDDELTRAKSVTIDAKHNSAILYLVVFTGPNGAESIVGGHTFDIDTIAEIEGGSVDFNSSNQVSWTGWADEDTDDIYIRVGAAPTAATNDGHISGSSGSHQTSVVVAAGSEAVVYVVGANGTHPSGVLGPVREFRRRNPGIDTPPTNTPRITSFSVIGGTSGGSGGTVPGTIEIEYSTADAPTGATVELETAYWDSGDDDYTGWTSFTGLPVNDTSYSFNMNHWKSGTDHEVNYLMRLFLKSSGGAVLAQAREDTTRYLTGPLT